MKRGVTVSTFDMCHAGHFMMLKEAKTVCDHLIVGLQVDASGDPASYRGKKKPSPILTLEERLEILSGCKYVDEIFIYTNEADLYKKLKALKYDIRIIGQDWKDKKFTGWDIDPEVYFNSRNHNYSTTELRDRVYRAEVERREQARQEQEDMQSQPQSETTASQITAYDKAKVAHG